MPNDETTEPETPNPSIAETEIPEGATIVSTGPRTIIVRTADGELEELPRFPTEAG